MPAWPRGPTLPTLSVCRSQGWAAIIQGPHGGLGSAVSPAVSMCCAWLAGPCGQGRGAEPRTTRALSWGLLQVRPR